MEESNHALHQAPAGISTATAEDECVGHENNIHEDSAGEVHHKFARQHDHSPVTRGYPTPQGWTSLNNPNSSNEQVADDLYTDPADLGPLFVETRTLKGDPNPTKLIEVSTSVPSPEDEEEAPRPPTDGESLRGGDMGPVIPAEDGEEDWEEGCSIDLEAESSGSSDSSGDARPTTDNGNRSGGGEGSTIESEDKRNVLTMAVENYQWELVDPDAATPPQLGHPDPDKLQIRIRDKVSKELRVLEFPSIPESEINWSNQKHITKINHWRWNRFYYYGLLGAKLKQIPWSP